MVKRYQSNAYDKRRPASGGAPSDVSVIMYRPPSESAPLLPGRRQRQQITTMNVVWGLGIFLLIIALVVMACYGLIHLMSCPPDQPTRDALRRDWDRETAQHALEEREWQRRKAAQDELERGWQREWVREVERHVREYEEMRRRDMEERERERRRWRQELEEREQREEEERMKRHLFWGNVRAQTCTTFGTRAYTAQLMNLPADWQHRKDACKATPLKIHGVSYLPSICEEQTFGIVTGRWEINQMEPTCTTYWDLYNDKGCTSPGSGKKYITYKLENLPPHSDWQEFCATTPASVNDMQFPGAQECFTSVWGVFGQWEIDDNNCH